MSKKYDMVVKTGEYTTSSGDKKSRWKTIGSALDNGSGLYLTMDASFNPAGVPRKEGSDTIIISLFEPKEKNTEVKKQQEQSEEIPF